MDVRRLVITTVVAVCLVSVTGTKAVSALTSSSKDQAAKTPSNRSIPPRADEATLEQFAPSTARTWWAIVDGYYSGSYVVRTVDGGRHWQDVRAATGVASGVFLNSEVAWVLGSDEQNPANSMPSDYLYRTIDGGRSWQRLGSISAACQLDFIDRLHGWCIALGAASGSSTFDLYRTVDGGSTWSLASSTGLNDTGSTPGDVPFGCDKRINFTSASVGWISSLCNGGPYYLFSTDDGGAEWVRRQVPLPQGTTNLGYGSSLGEPVVAGDLVAVSVEIGGIPGTTAVATSADGGLIWSTQVVPHPHAQWTVDLIDPTHWVLADGRRFMATNDAGARWRSWVSTLKMKDAVGSPLTPDFISPQVGWDAPLINPGPFWWTTDGGGTWKPVVVVAGRYRVPPP
jgi:photosystem II stability/assembly factor-like uncharacterized protein